MDPGFNIVKDIFTELMAANKKAKKASDNYNKFKDDLVADEMVANDKLNITGKIAQQRIDEKVDNNKYLKGFYNSYTFWTSEVARLNNVLNAIQIYNNLYDKTRRLL